MKKILFATTALVATAGIASAEVALTGSAEMGIIGGDVDGDAIETQFHTDIDVTFTMTGEADNGLTFGASIDLDESDGSGACALSDNDARANLLGFTGLLTINGALADIDGSFFDGDDDVVSCAVRGDSAAFSNTEQGGETIFISAGGATLTMGDTDGAFDAAMQEVNLAAGSINDDETEHAGFSGNAGLDGTYDGQIARFDYAFSGVTASLSAEIDDSGNGDPVWGLGLRYEGDFNGVALGVGLGYQTTNTADVEDVFNALVPGAPPVSEGVSMDIIGVSVDAGFSNGLSLGVNHSVLNIDGDEGKHTALGVGYEMNALAIGLNWGQFTADGDVISSGFGLAAAYDLGGGLAAQFGYGHSNFDVLDVTANTFSLGLAMSF